MPAPSPPHWCCRCSGLWPRWAWALAPPTLFLLPPLVVRLALLVRPLAAASIELGSGAFLLWWFTAQWQAIFNRLGFLEELLRLVPGLYGAWLRLWGARVGRLVYFSPECRVVDRPFVVLGHRVLLSIGARLSPHLVSRGPDGVARLLLAPIEIGDGAMIGGHSWLGPGAFVAPGEMTPAVYALPAFSRFEGGKRTHHHPTLI